MAATVFRKLRPCALTGALALITLTGPACGNSDAPSQQSPEPSAQPHDAAVAQVPLADAAPPPPPAYQVAATEAGDNWTVQQRAAAIAAGVQVVEKHQCTRCHEIDDQPSVGRPYECVGCHVFLKGLAPGNPKYEKIAKNNGKQVIDRYIENIEHLLKVPRLTGVARRVRPTWLAKYLAEPHDVRPVMQSSMIRHALTPEEITAITRYFAAIADAPDPAAPNARKPRRAPPPPSAERIAEGKRRFTMSGCPSCHAFGNEQLGKDVDATFLIAMSDRSMLAPNLRYARDRVRPEVIVDWILEPASILPGTPMPTPEEVSREDAELIRDFLLYSKLPPLPPPATAKSLRALPPPADHDVSWAEVKERVLGKVCVHCHMNDYEKDTGPGNLGGFGYLGRKLSFRTYERSVSGAEDPEGKRYSVFQRLPGEQYPRVIEMLLRRRIENQRDYLPPFQDHQLPPYEPGLLGMPMGLPAMTDEEIGILLKWIELDCPGPTEVTGTPGFTDGFLVPDGPIAKNSGCELRPPAATPPPWSSAPQPQ